MIWHRKAVRATKAERERMDALKLLGCIACRMTGSIAGTPEIHHLLSGNKRRGHAFTIPLCPWHHRGEMGGLWNATAHERALGPSLARGSKRFHATFGTDDELLARTNQALANTFGPNGRAES